MTFPEIGAPPRTDDSFRNRLHEGHHTGILQFLELPINMIDQFPLDYMHLCCQGVMRKLIVNLWMKGPNTCRIGGTLVNSISQSLIGCRNSVPDEFARKPRGLGEIDRWKATEFRQFLLYTGPVVLYKKLPPLLYKHFLFFLHCNVNFAF